MRNYLIAGALLVSTAIAVPARADDTQNWETLNVTVNVTAGTDINTAGGGTVVLSKGVAGAGDGLDVGVDDAHGGGVRDGRLRCGETG